MKTGSYICLTLAAIALTACKNTPFIIECDLAPLLSTRNLIFDAEGNEATEVSVHTNKTWDFHISDCDAEWLRAERTEWGIAVSVTDNTGNSKRDGTILVNVAHMPNNPYRIHVEQRIAPLRFNGIGGEYKIIESDHPNMIRAWSSQEWIYMKPDPDTGTITITTDKNTTGSQRKGDIVIRQKNRPYDTLVQVIQYFGRRDLSTFYKDIDLTQAMKDCHAVLTIRKGQPEYQEHTDLWITMHDKALTPKEEGLPDGTGWLLKIAAHCSRSEMDDSYGYMPNATYEADDYEYIGPDGPVYKYPTVQEGILKAGHQITGFPGEERMYTWYTYYENGQPVNEGPITNGSMTVKRDGDTYNIVLDFKISSGSKITGTFNRTFDEVIIAGNR